MNLLSRIARLTEVATLGGITLNLRLVTEIERELTPVCNQQGDKDRYSKGVC
jgi:hypothetical protein